MRIRLPSLRALSPTVAAVAVLAGCQPGNPDGLQQVTDAQRTAVTREVAQAVDSLFADMNAHDPDRVYEHYRKSDDFLYVTVHETMRSWKTFSSVTRSYYAQNPDVTFQHRIVQIQVLTPNVAVATIKGSTPDSPYLTWTDVFVREGGRWVITLENEAWPGAKPPAAPHPAMQMPGDQGAQGTSGGDGASGGGTGGL